MKTPTSNVNAGNSLKRRYPARSQNSTPSTTTRVTSVNRPSFPSERVFGVPKRNANKRLSLPVQKKSKTVTPKVIRRTNGRSNIHRESSSSWTDTSSLPRLETPPGLQCEAPVKAKRIKELNFTATAVKGFYRDNGVIKAVVSRADEEYSTVVHLKAVAKQNIDIVVDAMLPHIRIDRLRSNVRLVR